MKNNTRHIQNLMIPGLWKILTIKSPIENFGKKMMKEITFRSMIPDIVNLGINF